jgi:hypothetical protein
VLTSDLLTELARSGAEAERRQRKSYADLAAEMAVPAETHEARAAGATDEEQQEIAEAHMKRLGIRTRRGQKELVLDDAARLLLRDELAGVVASVDGKEITIDAVLGNRVVPRRTLLAFITAGLRRAARMRYLQTQTLLREGLPHATIRGGRITAKVILGRAEDGSIGACFANETTVESAGRDTVSELTFDFNVEAFPPMR